MLLVFVVHSEDGARGIPLYPSSLMQQTADLTFFVFIKMGMVTMAIIITTMMPMIQFSSVILRFIRLASLWNNYVSPLIVIATTAVLERSSVLSTTSSSFSPRCRILSTSHGGERGTDVAHHDVLHALHLLHHLLHSVLLRGVVAVLRNPVTGLSDHEYVEGVREGSEGEGLRDGGHLSSMTDTTGTNP